jgi:hypothetical protein
MIICSLSGCLKGQPEEELVYFNNFEQESRLEGAAQNKGYLTSTYGPNITTEYNHSTVLGRFGTGGVLINLEQLPAHDYIRIEFDLYIHDSWEGNGLRGNGEDVFILNLDETTLYFSSIINTKCLDKNCTEKQSFPAIIRAGVNPENAFVTDPSLPGACYWSGDKGGTKKIRITELYPHSNIISTIKIGADIKDAGDDLCFKSWSVDNIMITTLQIPDL